MFVNKVATAAVKYQNHLSEFVSVLPVLFQ